MFNLFTLVERLVLKVSEFFSTLEKNKCPPEPQPDFDDMLNWSKIQIDMHADTFGIKLDRRKTKIKMIEDFRDEYDNMMITKAQSESRG
jgi:hypothetical protein